MQYQFSIFALALSITLTSAQSITDVPQCAYNAALKSIGSSKCTLTDMSCICKSSDWLTTLLPEVSKDCSPADLDKTRSVTVAICKGLGIDLVLPSGTTGAVSPATATSAASSGASPTSAAKSGASAAATSASSVVASLASSASVAVASATGTGSATTFGPQSGLLGMIGIAMGMMVL